MPRAILLKERGHPQHLASNVEHTLPDAPSIFTPEVNPVVQHPKRELRLIERLELHMMQLAPLVPHQHVGLAVGNLWLLGRQVIGDPAAAYPLAQNAVRSAPEPNLA